MPLWLDILLAMQAYLAAGYIGWQLHVWQLRRKAKRKIREFMDSHQTMIAGVEDELGNEIERHWFCSCGAHGHDAISEVEHRANTAPAPERRKRGRSR